MPQYQPATSVPTATCSRCGLTDIDTAEVFQPRRRATQQVRWCRPCGRAYNAARRSERAGTSRRKFGVEIEFVGSRYAVAEALRNEGIPCVNEGYNHQVRRHWKVVTDSSVSDGGELVSPPLRGAAGRRQLRKVCKALEAAGATVNRSCGLHVHHDISDLSAQSFGRIYRFWFENQINIDQLVSRSRHANAMCRPVCADYVQRAETLSRLDRYTVLRQFSGITKFRALNALTYARQGTVEVRLHQGTTNAKKIIAWVDFGQAIISAAASSDYLAGAPTLDAMLASLVTSGGLSEANAAYLTERATELAAPARRRRIARVA